MTRVGADPARRTHRGRGIHWNTRAVHSEEIRAGDVVGALVGRGPGPTPSRPL